MFSVGLSSALSIVCTCARLKESPIELTKRSDYSDLRVVCYLLL